MKKKFQYLLLLFLSAVSVFAHAQTVLYSETETTKFNSDFHIIGQVKDHILVWITDETNYKNAQFLIYDNNMHLLNKVKPHVIVPAKIYVTTFINNADSFQLIYQYLYKKNYICKRFVFDENGNCMGAEKVDSIYTSASEDSYRTLFSNLVYQTVISDNKKSFALIRLPHDQQKNTLDVNYRFFNLNTETNNSQTLPFDISSTELCNVLLDKNNNLVLVLATYMPANFQLGIYKIDLTNNGIINSLRQLQDGFIVDNTLNISENNENYVVTGEWKKAQDKKDNGIYLWHLNKDLTDAETDTVIDNDIQQLPYIQSINFFDVRPFTTKNNTVQLFISSKEIPGKYFYGGNSISSQQSPSLNEYSYFGDNVYPNTYDALRNFVYKTQAIDQAFSHNNYNNAYKAPPQKPQDLKLISLQLDNKNKVIKAETFTGAIDSELISEINEAEIFQSGSDFNILFKQQISSKKSGLGYIKVYANNEFKYSEVILMHLKYEVMLNQSVQLNAYAVIIPATISNRLAFIKVTFN